MIEVIQEADQQLFLWLNSLHLPWLDPVMYRITNKYTWFPAYALIVVVLLIKYKWEGAKMIVLLVLIIIACDQLTSGFMKPFFERLRPCHNPGLTDQVHVVEGCGGKYGFASSHAANTFGFATGLWLLLRSWSRWFVWGFAWAGVVSYTRIYVGVHYPLDILIGAILGAAIAIIFYQLYRNFNRRLLNTSSVE
ncbi:phosphatase PAP2 family protein [Tunicatimonas pelagia]|uniref:phosphatase PAP2 family protein n=1 Tax=Tunicatimonas pelagia TaxID=931531 RepID=UPI00266589A2|nr:phosphatase PAP2 family protein [Tunicatimonas pelagia]WKN44432.1 phosphatase PAP2 family protein [Tunicatimonas pelagia]